MNPLSERFRQLVRPLEAFFRTEALGGTILFAATLIALGCANSPWGDSYGALFSHPIAMGLGRGLLTLPLTAWVDDLLMAAFFLLVGLEIKRELLLGELNSIPKAALPAVAALGGMVVPAALFFGVAHVAYGVMPLFAVANAGIRLEGLPLPTLVSPVALGVLLGLVAGKPLGILGASVLAVRAGWAQSPEGVRWRQMVGFSVLGGIGFTMSLFIASLAFGEGGELHRQAKLGVLIGSTVSGVAGLLLLRLATATAAAGHPEPVEGRTAA